MQVNKQKCLKILGTFSKKELQNFKNHLSSPQTKIRQQKKCVELYQSLVQKSRLERDETGVAFWFFPPSAIQDIAQKLFVNGKNKGLPALTTCLSYIYKTLQIYIGQLPSISTKSAFNSQLVFLEFLQKRKLYHLFDLHYKEIQNELTTAKQSENIYELEKKLELLRLSQLSLDSNKKGSVDLSTLFKLTARHNLINALKLICSQQNLISTRVVSNEAIPLHHTFQNFEGQTKDFEDALIYLYYTTYQVFKGIQEVSTLFDLIKKYQQKIDVLEVQSLITYVKNICIKQLWEGIETPNRLLIHEVNKYLDEINLLAPDEKISIRNFLNTVNESSKNQQFAWGHQFIEKYHHFLPKDNQTKIASVGKSLLFFGEKNYAKTIEILDTPTMFFDHDPVLETNRRTLVIKAYYESQQFEDLYYQIERYLSYLRKTLKITKSYNQLNKVFLQHLKKLLKLQEVDTSKRKLKPKLLQLKQNIESKRMANKQWLMEKLLEVTGEG